MHTHSFFAKGGGVPLACSSYSCTVNVFLFYSPRVFRIEYGGTISNYLYHVVS